MIVMNPGLKPKAKLIVASKGLNNMNKYVQLITAKFIIKSFHYSVYMKRNSAVSIAYTKIVYIKVIIL